MSDPEKAKMPKARRPKAEAKERPQERQLRIRLVKSLIGYPRPQRAVAQGLGLGKLNSEVVRKETPEILGMIRKIVHLLKVEAKDVP